MSRVSTRKRVAHRPNPHHLDPTTDQPEGPVWYRALIAIARQAVRMQSFVRSLAAGSLAAAVALTACSGSDGSTSSTPRAPVIDRAARPLGGRSRPASDPACRTDPVPRAQGRTVPVRLTPRWDTAVGVNRFSSPVVADLNGDAAPDVVVAGGVQSKTGSVTAVDGATGKRLWQREFPDELYATPLVTRAGPDHRVAVVVGGRIKDTLALDGATGTTIWSFVGVNPTVQTDGAATGTATSVPDFDGDGVADLVFTQSGDTGDRDPRPPALFQFVSAATGVARFTFVAPDGREVYSVPAVQSDPIDPRAAQLTYGSGGATLPGHLTRIRVPLGPSVTPPAVPRLWEIASKPLGITSAPIVVTGGGRPDNVIATEFGGHAVRVTAADGRQCWRTRKLPGVLPTTPAIGRFAGIGGPGVVVKTLGGQGVLLWLDGRDGRVAASARVGSESWASPLTADLNGDGLDEVVLSAVTDVPPGGFEEPSAKASTHLLVFDGRTRRVLVDRTLRGWSSATPTITDLDGDGRLELLVPHLDRLTCFTIDGAPNPSVAVGNYRGPSADGVVPIPR
jgi:outer membrane protein assembly factor BamB